MSTTYEQLASGLVVPSEPPPKPEPSESGCVYCGCEMICTIGSLGNEKFPQNLCGGCKCWFPIEERDRAVAKSVISTMRKERVNNWAHPPRMYVRPVGPK